MSGDYDDKVRLLVAKREDEDIPYVIAAFPMSTWEIIPPEDWDSWKRERAEAFFDADWTAYDYVEAVVTIPWRDLAQLFAVTVTATDLTVAKEDPK